MSRNRFNWERPDSFGNSKENLNFVRFQKFMIYILEKI